MQEIDFIYCGDIQNDKIEWTKVRYDGKPISEDLNKFNENKVE